MEGKLIKSTYNFSKRKKKKNCFLLIPLKEDGLGPNIHLGGVGEHKQQEKQPEILSSKSTFDFSDSAYEQMKVL